MKRMDVKDVMTPEPVTITPETSVSEAQMLMKKRAIRHLPVVENGRLVGIFTDRDLRTVSPSPATSLSAWEMTYLLTKLTVREVMTRFVMTVAPDCPLTEAVGLMLGHKVGALPVVEAQRVIGILTQTDVLRALLKAQTTWSHAA
jgi:CBS domain-containing protein